VASSYTTGLRFNKQGQGDNRNSWGTVFNAGGGSDLIDEAISGFASIAMANANVTLTANNGSTDQARCAVLHLTGANTAIRTVTIPAARKVYIVNNATTGGFAVTISNGVNSVNVGAASTALVWTDGTSVYQYSGTVTSGSNLVVTGSFTSPGIDDNATAERLQISDTLIDVGSSTAASDYVIERPIADGTLTLQCNSIGAHLKLYGSTHATFPSDYVFFQGASTEIYRFSSTNAKHTFTGSAYISGTTRLGQNTTDNPGLSNNTVGAAISSTGYGAFSGANGSIGGLSVNQTSSSGTIASWNLAGTSQGSLSGSGSTISYNAFFGSHWSQLLDGSRPDILRGTICESIDEMCQWPDEPREERLPCFKISDTPGSKAVYGVFAWWDDGWEATNDAHIGALGAYVIRIAKGQTVKRGDLIESDGTGCGRVQADDLMRSSTVAKITSATIVETYPDGSYVVPCTLHCG
jgi:hypothetical protein